MDINELYLDDIRILDINASKYKSAEKFKDGIKNKMKADILCKEVGNSDKEYKQNKLSLEAEGCIHAALLSLFLRESNIALKFLVKEKVKLLEMDYLDEYLKKDVMGKLPFSESLFDKILIEYYNNLENEMKILDTDQEFIKQINEYYKDSSSRIQKIANELSDELRKVGI